MHRTAPTLLAVLLIVALTGCSENKPGGPAVPMISLSSDTLEFSAVAGGANPPNQKVAVSNVGVGDINIQASSSADWISVIYSQGLEPDTVSVTVSTAKVSAGTTIDSVAVMSSGAGNSPQYIKVLFTVSKRISINLGTLVFSALAGGENPDPQYFQIINQGGGFMSFSIDKSASWLSLTRTTGTAPDSVGVTIDIAGLAAGLYVDTLTISSPEATNDSAKLVVTLASSSWTLSNQGISSAYDLQGLTFSAGNIGWAVGFIGNTPEFAGIIVKSVDSGRTWADAFLRTGGPFGDIAFINESTGFVVGDGGVIVRTDDEGDTWIDVDNVPLDSTYALWSLEFSSPSRGHAVGTKGAILRTTDSGVTWWKIASPTSLSLAAISFADDLNGWIVGNNGKILHTSNGGITWEIQSAETNSDLWGICFPDINTGWAVGDAGLVIHTIDGGATWEQVDVGVTEKLQDIFFIDDSHAWIVGRGGTIVHTMDGGDSWLPQFTETEEWLFEAYFFDADNGLVVGNNGTVLRTERGGF